MGNAPSSVKGRGLRTNGYPWWVAATDRRGDAALGALRERRLRTTRGIAEVDRRCLHSVRLIWSD